MDHLSVTSFLLGALGALLGRPLSRLLGALLFLALTALCRKKRPMVLNLSALDSAIAEVRAAAGAVGTALQRKNTEPPVDLASRAQDLSQVATALRNMADSLAPAVETAPMETPAPETSPTVASDQPA